MCSRMLVVLTIVMLSACATAPPPESQVAKPSQALLPEITPKPEQTRPALTLTLTEDERPDFYLETAGCEGSTFTLRDLYVSEVRVSNNDLSSIANTLNLMGYSVMDLRNPVLPPSGFACDQLPLLVIPTQSTGSGRPGTGGGMSPAPGGYGGPGPHGSSATSITPLDYSDASELDRFIVYYHPSQKLAVDKLRWLVATKLDAPSAQVYIETMVLEVRQEDSEEFGMEYSKADNDKLFTLGNLVPGLDTTAFERNTIVDAFTGVRVFQPGIGKRYRLKALIDEGKAEVLSRPSVLAISNRQAAIQIVDVIQSPVVTSSLTSQGDLSISGYSFEPLLIGITLNLKPRVSADRNWLTLEIDATVDSEDDENNGQVFGDSPSGPVLLAERQGSSSKKVRTFARIPDRTPIIIGGLVSKKKEERQGKLPLLNRIPGVGKLFTSRDNEVQNREIIIVLTPYILDERGYGIDANRPNAQVRERSKESQLFNR